MIPATMSIDSRVFRQAVGQFVTGVTVIAIEVDDEIRAMTANSFTSLSLDPPLVLFCLGRQTKAGQLIHRASAFSVNILCEEQQDLSTYFAGAWKHAAPPPFTFTSWREGAPRLDGSAVSLGCVTQSIHEGGDHFVVGEVVAIHRSEEPQPPLVFFGGRYMSLKQLS
jgi:3-hydroxy-9,10-secoandrosta-1,3,5(10)-triene-9,17-dione monooxygenase reductase component